MLKKGYTAIILDNASRTSLLSKFTKNIPAGWDVIAHHMTINPFETNSDERIGKNVELFVTDIGLSKTAIAVKVRGYDRQTKNSFPHITLAINKTDGGKPKDSNEIKNWVPAENLSITGTIQNIIK